MDKETRSGNDERRLALIRDLRGTDRAPELERLTRLARRVFRVAAAHVTLLDDNTQWIKAGQGLEITHCPRQDSICRYTIEAQSGRLVIPDLSTETRFAESLVGKQGYRFYAGIVLRSREGLPLGAFCLLDTQPQELDADEIATLADLAALAEREFHLWELSQRALREHATPWLGTDQESALQSIVDHLPVLVAYVGRDRHYRYANAFYQEWTGIDRNHVMGRHIREVFGPEFEAFLEPYIETALSGRQAVYESETFLHGQKRQMRGVMTPDLRPDGSIPGYFLMAQDITARKALEDTLKQQAREDPLTGLPNRRAAMEAIDAALARQTRVKKGLALMFLDLDGFKEINDSLGHDAGDALLQQFAGRLLAAVRSTDMVARLAGDEFVILLEHLKEADMDAHLLAGKLIATMNAPFQLTQGSVKVTTSIGIAINPPGGQIRAGDLVTAADKSMYRAKRQGKNRYVLAGDRRA
ncbi:sensor domain-containing diguanylate cyclase [Paludibacterium paludis]|uniref:PAS domain S-box-containing protein/diguanylate cyclase (GGDEF)-like protein n=1 Tax=Paludibacterium paludis TaxID=1225769 RepID=A0A918P4M9_9NEIS|nr:diguanylate cyclase [Paludibacterium paludis]GGY17214.1 hypothetical protein GCM10011289_20730 [Paludibacterium paludis]